MVYLRLRSHPCKLRNAEHNENENPGNGVSDSEAYEQMNASVDDQKACHPST